MATAGTPAGTPAGLSTGGTGAGSGDGGPAPLAVELRGITKRFPGVIALDSVNLTVRAGEIHAICGENGAGKATLMKVLSGVYPAGRDDGEIVYEGQPVRFNGIRDSENVGIVIINQALALVPELTIAENISLHNERV